MSAHAVDSFDRLTINFTMTSWINVGLLAPGQEPKLGHLLEQRVKVNRKTKMSRCQIAINRTSAFEIMQQILNYRIFINSIANIQIRLTI